MASKSNAIQASACVEACVCSSSELHNAHMISQEIMHLVGYSLCTSACLRMPTFACACLCVRAGHPEAARPDVLESGLCRVMSGSLADSADFEQCTQVSPANELSI